MPKMCYGVEIKKANHLLIRPLQAGDLRPDGVSYAEDSQYVAFVKSSNVQSSLAKAPAIPVFYVERTDWWVVAKGAWHLNTDPVGVKSLAGTLSKCYFTRPLYVYENKTVYQGTIRFFPRGQERVPLDISPLEMFNAYTALANSAKRVLREEADNTDEDFLNFHCWRLKIAQRGLKRLGG